MFKATWRGETHNSVWQGKLKFLLVQLVQYQMRLQCSPSSDARLD